MAGKGDVDHFNIDQNRNSCIVIKHRPSMNQIITLCKYTFCKFTYVDVDSFFTGRRILQRQFERKSRYLFQNCTSPFTSKSNVRSLSLSRF